MNIHIHWRDWLIALVGAWLIASPHVFDYVSLQPALSNAYALGAIIFAFNILSACRTSEQGQDLFNLVLGSWLLFAPYALHFQQSSAPAANAIAAGLLVICLASWQIRSDLHEK